MTKKITKNKVNTKRNKSKKLLWFAISGIVLALALVAAIFLFPRSDSNATKFQLATNAPSAVQFADKNTVSFSVGSNIPDINNNRILKDTTPLIVFYNWVSGPFTPAFSQNITDQELNKLVKITPFIKGTWTMRASSSLVFTPEQDWPADKKFTVKIDKKLLNSDTDPDSYKISFKTDELTAKVESFTTYPAPDAKKSVISVAVISFNYPIDTKDFKDKVSLKLDDEKLDFSVKFDRYQRTAFITSAPVAITNSVQTIRLKVNKIPALYGDAKTEKINAETTIESIDNIFKISDLSSITADDKEGNPQQLILLNTTEQTADSTDWSKNISAYLLPATKDKNESSHDWQDDEITPEVIKKAKKIELKKVNFENPNGVFQYAFSYDITEKSPRYMYVSVNSGIESTNGFVMKNGVNKVLQVAYPTAEVKIAGSGALLSLAGSKKLGLVARGGVRNAYVNLYKVKSSEINHLISQTYNVFSNNLEFKSWSFDAYDMSNVFQKRIPFANPAANKVNYASLDLGDYLNKTGTDKTGIFIIQTGDSQNQADYNDKRLILLTDLGIIRKVNLDNTSTLFVSYLSSGAPAANTPVYVLGRNGNAIWTGKTNENGRAEIPTFPWEEYKNAKEPVAIVARQDNDVTFIPYSAYAQQVEYSKFDVDGVYSSNTMALNAFVFTDRGIYRPGEQAIIGNIVKNKDFDNISGIPVKFEIRDSKGRTVLEKTLSLKSDGMFDIKYDISDRALLGEYQASVFSLNDRNQPEYLLGSTLFKVEEFVPDTMKISANIIGATEEGWSNPETLKASVSLRNLFGTPATDRRISTTAILKPVDFSFKKYAEYTFTPNFISGSGLSDNTAMRIQTISQEMEDVRTDKEGNAEFDVKFDRTIPSGSYMLTLNIRGFEGDSGKSVQTSVTTRVSDAKYLVGYKTSSNLSYVNRDAKRSIEFIALDHTGNLTRADNLKLRLIRKETATSLVKDYSGFYKYQTVSKDEMVSQQTISISEKGTEFTLDTANAGQYYLQLLDSANKVLANVEYFVAASGNVNLQTDANAELKIKLNASEYKPGENIVVNITSPYTGSGLITIERDKVYAYKWFKTDTTSSQQSITLPQGFEGTGYVNVSFVRDINSRDIFTTPYTYAVADFTADISKRRLAVKMQVPEKISDNKLTVKYSTNKDADIMIFAVNQGILQVAKYQIPNPLAHFFKKSALQVSTYQILSLLLPEYKILAEYAKTGGGDFEGTWGDMNQVLTNPFGRKNLPPVAFYSGIIKTSANKTNSISFDIPEYFNGALQVFAVAANDGSLGAADAQVKVQSPVIVSTTAPLAVAPNDTFEVNSVISNLTEESGEKATAKISVKLSDKAAQITSPAPEQVEIPQDSEKLVSFSVQAGKELGSTDINIEAKIADNSGKILSTGTSTNSLSIRPTTTFTTKITTGEITSDKETVKDFKLEMYPAFAANKLYIASDMAILAKPLISFLDKYEYSCSEQLVSKALPYALLANNKLYGVEFKTAQQKISDTINELKNRQNVDGSFDLWASNSDINREFDANAAYTTAYVSDFLSIAKEKGFNVPANMQSRAIDFLRTYAGTPATNEQEAAAKAFAIYVITKNGFVTTNYIDSFEEYANANIKDWQETLMGAYIATSYKLLKQDDKADKMIAQYTPAKSDKAFTFDSAIANNAIYTYLSNKYFGKDALPDLKEVSKYINRGFYSSYNSAMLVMALSNSTDAQDLADLKVIADDKQISGDGIYDIPQDAKKVEIICPTCTKDNKLYYTALQQGYPTESHKASNDLEIVREYYDEFGNKINSGKIGDTVEVKIFVRAKGNAELVPNVVITDLLPGGFIADSETLSGETEFAEFREDRVLLFANISRSEQVISYKAQLGSAGKFAIPAIQAQSMDNPAINATGETGTFTVNNAQ